MLRLGRMRGVPFLSRLSAAFLPRFAAATQKILTCVHDCACAKGASSFIGGRSVESWTTMLPACAFALLRLLPPRGACALFPA